MRRIRGRGGKNNAVRFCESDREEIRRHLCVVALLHSRMDMQRVDVRHYTVQ